MNAQGSKKRILLVCGGNTCRSPMAKVILEQKLMALDKLNQFEIDSAASSPTHPAVASANARQAIQILFKKDLLASHKAKELTPQLMKSADLILVMTARMKNGLPPGKTWTLKEYAGGSGDVDDPFGSGLDAYLKCAGEMAKAFDAIIPKLLPFI